MEDGSGKTNRRKQISKMRASKVLTKTNKRRTKSLDTMIRDIKTLKKKPAFRHTRASSKTIRE